MQDNVEGKRSLLSLLARLAVLSRDVDSGVQLYGRIKSVASTTNKMARYGVSAERILDIIGVRAVTAHTRDCYRLIERIHSEFSALPGEYDDYVAAPKPNGYRSLHTTVVSPCGIPIEIQVRTGSMHTHAERGGASHTHYKMHQAMEVRRG